MKDIETRQLNVVYGNINREISDVKEKINTERSKEVKDRNERYLSTLNQHLWRNEENLTLIKEILENNK